MKYLAQFLLLLSIPCTAFAGNANEWLFLRNREASPVSFEFRQQENQVSSENSPPVSNEYPVYIRFYNGNVITISSHLAQHMGIFNGNDHIDLADLPIEQEALELLLQTIDAIRNAESFDTMDESALAATLYWNMYRTNSNQNIFRKIYKKTESPEALLHLLNVANHCQIKGITDALLYILIEKNDPVYKEMLANQEAINLAIRVYTLQPPYTAEEKSNANIVNFYNRIKDALSSYGADEAAVRANEIDRRKAFLTEVSRLCIDRVKELPKSYFGHERVMENELSILEPKSYLFQAFMISYFMHYVNQFPDYERFFPEREGLLDMLTSITQRIIAFDQETRTLDLSKIEGYPGHFDVLLPNLLPLLEVLLSSEIHAINLSQNWLSGNIPVSLSSLTNLQNLNLSRNDFSGEIPAELFVMLSNLHTIHLYKNKFTGSIPRQLCTMQQLKTLNVASNHLNGILPPELGHLQNLEQLFLFDNQLTGEIPESLGNLAQLEGLALANNKLIGNIPMSLGNLRNLVVLYLNNNRLSGNIPEVLADLPRLTTLTLANNWLSGRIPEAFARSNIREFTFINNELDRISSPALVNKFGINFTKDITQQARLNPAHTYYRAQNR